MANDRQYDFGSGEAGAGDVAREFFYVGYNERSGLSPAGAAYAAAFFNAGAGYGTLEGAEYQLVSFYEVKSDPKPVELFLQGGDSICEVGHEVGLAIDECLDLRNDRLILGYFVSLYDA